VNGVIGAGIFLLPGRIAHAAGPWAWAVYVSCAALCFLIALSFADMGSRFGSTGGAYLYALEAFGPFVGFLVGWIVWLSAILGWASVAVGLADTMPSIGLAWLAGRWARVGFVALLVGALAALNARGARMGAMANNLFSIAKMLPLALFVGLGLAHAVASPFAVEAHWRGKEDVFSAMLWALFLYSGFEEIAVPAGETRDARKAVPRALFLVLGFATAVYVIVHLVAQAVYPGLGGSDRAPLADAAGAFLGTAGLLLVGVGSVVSLLGTNASIAFTGPRSLYALSRDGFMPALFEQLDRRWQTPLNAIAATAVLVVLLPLVDWLHLQAFSLDTLVQMSALASLLQYIATCAGVIALRRREGRGRLEVPAVALTLCLALFALSAPPDRTMTLIGVALGLPLYLARRRPT
jgi:amino acid transporter